MKKFFSGLILLAAVVLLASCQDDLFDWGKDTKLTKGQIAFTIGSDKGGATRAEISRTVVAPTNVYELTTDEESGPGFCLIETVSQLGEETFDTYTGAVTRGTPIYTENFEAAYGGFVGTPFAYPTEDDFLVWGGQSRVNFDLLDSDNRVYMHDFGELEWPDNKELLFFLEAPKDLNNYGVSNVDYSSLGTIHFDYTSPEDPKNQKDILFTSKTIKEGTKNTDNRIKFYHALTGVKFKLGYNTTHDVKVTINKITFHNYPSTGQCTVRPADDLNAKSAACVVWDNLGDAKSFSVDFTKIYDENGELVNGYDQYNDEDVKGLIHGTEAWKKGDGVDYSYFPESFFANGKEGGLYENESTADRNFNNKYYEYTFMFIPHQEAADTSYIEIDFTYRYTQAQGDTYMPLVPHQNVSRVSLPSFANTWLPGELHTYILTSEGVDILVKDKIEDDWKSAVEVVNTGTYPEWQRALMCGNWVYTDETAKPANHLIVASADYRANGKFCNTKNESDLGGFVGPNWALGSDGFFYYRYPVNVGNKPNFPLFKWYKGPEYTTFNGTHLELAIGTQAIRYSTDTQSRYNKSYAVDKWRLSTDAVTIVEHGPVMNAGTAATDDQAGTLGGTTQVAAANAYQGQPMSNWLQSTMEIFNTSLPGNSQVINP